MAPTSGDVEKAEATLVADDLKERVARTDHPNSKQTTDSATGEEDAKKSNLAARLTQIFITSCVFGVFLDPLFLYIPLLNQDLKCLRLDNTIKIIALVSRSFTDLFYVGRIILQVCRLEKYSPSIRQFLLKKPSSKLINGLLDLFPEVSVEVEKPRIGGKEIWESSIIVDILAILPLPQVAILIFFSEMRDLRSLNTIRMVIMNLFVLLQYMPRILRIYLSFKELRRTPKIETEETAKWIKGLLNFFMYIIASHVVGAIWYFFAIQRMAICWRDACRKENGCNTSAFGCQDDHIFRNITFLNDLCPTSLVNTTLFDFGIYITVLQSGISGSTNYFEKFSKCFWWGLQNLSSFGSNLAPSINGWENLFAAFTSIIGLLLFLYLIGNLQAYMQFDTTRIEARRHKWKVKRKMKEKSQQIESWLFGIPESLNKDIKSQIMDKVQQEFEEGRDADLDNILSTFPLKLQNEIKSCEPIARLKRVPTFQNMDESVLKAICKYLEPKKYTKNHIITQEGELMMLLIVDGFENIQERDGSINLQRVSREVYGEKLLDWPLSNSFPDVLPSATVSAVGDVKAYTLTANDLKTVVLEFKREYFFGMIECKKFSEKEVEKAIQNYHASRIIREQQTITPGGLSTSVYKGELPDKTVVEVKRYRVNCSYYDYPYLVKLVAVASRTNHINLVRLLGCCLEKKSIALVSEYIPNGTLFEHIHGKEGKASSPLSLELRMKIASETAGALAYLRSLTTTPILPAFVSTSSILLDDNCTAKLCSFGLRFGPNDSRYSLSSIRQGCFDPESKTLLEKLDVYGIGVVLAELLTGPNAIALIGKRDLEKLKILFLSLVKVNRLNEILDDKIIEGGDFETAKKAAHLATRCLRYEEKEMPSMKEVVAELEGILRNLRAEKGGEASSS